MRHFAGRDDAWADRPGIVRFKTITMNVTIMMTMTFIVMYMATFTFLLIVVILSGTA